MLEYRKTHPYKTYTFTISTEANELNDKDTFAFLLCACVDRGGRAEIAWSTALALKKRLGHLDPRRIALMSPSDIQPLLPRGLRYPARFSRTIVDCAKKVVEKWHGDASLILRSEDIRDLLASLDEIFGVGPGIAAMIVNILMCDGKLKPPPEELSKVDVKADVHIRRVFFRTGLSDSDTEKAAVEAARKANPRYPGELDMPAWQIGREYCDPGFPHCRTCPLEKACLKQGP